MNRLQSALGAIPCAELSHDDWIRVGMALKDEGYPLSVWEEWSALDAARYRPGECAKRWATFNGSPNPVKAGTIFKMAQSRGWSFPSVDDGAMDWTDVISYDGEGSDLSLSEPDASPPRLPTEQAFLYMSTLYRPEDHVGYVTGDVFQREDGRWSPGRGVYSRTAGEIMESLRRYPNDLGATFGDWKPEAGAYIRINPLDGAGVKNDNVTAFRFALVESDSLPIQEQIDLCRKLELPIAALVTSGGKSVHAIVHIDAANAKEYRERVTFLFDFLNSHGMKVDTNNKNPSRLSRLPGATRNGNLQQLLAVNIGRKSWTDWLDFVEGVTDELPALNTLESYSQNIPPLPLELIKGVLRLGHKMLISGSSKAGKSFLLMELCIAIAEGLTWLSFPCRKGRVLYVNLEIDPASCVHRFLNIYKALGIPPTHMDDIIIWNLRGHAVPLDQLVPKLVRRVRDLHLDAIIIDPIYKVITGDENSASDMAAFCNQFDRICNETNCSVIYCHHHSKGAQGAKRAMDRASGSGVFARDPDAQLDMIELELSDHVKNWEAKQGATAWRLESSLREFPNIRPVNFWFEYPIHRVDDEENLKEMPAQGSADAGRMKNRFSKTAENAAEEFRTAFYMSCLGDDSVTVQDIMSYLGISDKTVYARIRKMNGEFVLKKGRIYHNDQYQFSMDDNSSEAESGAD